MSRITINHANGAIEMSKAVAKKAGVFGSQLYNDLIAARRDFPEYSVKIVENQKRTKPYMGMGVDFVKSYINDCVKDKKIKDEFKGFCESNLVYTEIMKWFVDKYPKFKEFTKRSEWILAAVHDKEGKNTNEEENINNEE